LPGLEDILLQRLGDWRPARHPVKASDIFQVSALGVIDPSPTAFASRSAMTAPALETRSSMKPSVAGIMVMAVVDSSSVV